MVGVGSVYWIGGERVEGGGWWLGLDVGGIGGWDGGRVVLREWSLWGCGWIV